MLVTADGDRIKIKIQCKMRTLATRYKLRTTGLPATELTELLAQQDSKDWITCFGVDSVERMGGQRAASAVMGASEQLDGAIGGGIASKVAPGMKSSDAVAAEDKIATGL